MVKLSGKTLQRLSSDWRARRLDSLRQMIETERPPFERIASLLQGGGPPAHIRLASTRRWQSQPCIPTGSPAFRSAPSLRLDYRQFRETITTPPSGRSDIKWFELKGEFVHSLINQARSWGALLGGAPDFFTPRVPPSYLQSKRTPKASSYCDVTR